MTPEEKARVPVRDLTIRECRKLATFFQERYMWATNAESDLWTAAMLLYVALQAEKRCPEWWRTIREASEKGPQPYAFIDENIHGMVGHFSEDKPGRDILDRIVRTTGLSDWDARNDDTR